MKQYSLYFIYGLLGLLLAGCTNTDLDSKISVKEGIPVVARLSFSIPDVNKIETRAFEDKIVTTLYLFAFKPNGSFITGKKHTVTESSTSVEFQTITGEQNIYAVANPLNDMFQKEIINKLEAFVKDGCNREELSDLIVSFETGQEAISFGNSDMVMSGAWKDEKNNISCTINENGNPVTPGKIQLKRIGSKINFSVASKEGVTFVMESYQVCDVPSQVPLFDDFESTNKMKFFSSPKVTNSSQKNEFSFYILENKIKGKDNGSILSVNDREKLSLGSLKAAPDERTFANVGKPATYVLLHGSYRGPSTSQKQTVEAQVTYCIHLGKGADANFDFTDFTTYRNCDYTYNLTVNGVDNIIAEVIETNKDFPREEGDVIVSGSENLIRCDAHFEAREISFEKSQLMKKEVFNFVVKDPSTNNQYVEDKDLTDSLNLDWVHFRYNKDINSNSNSKFQYPGKKALDYTDNTRLIKVNTLVSELEKWTKGKSSLFDNEASTVHMTAFVSEYYYQDIHWGKFVNTDDREMLIICKKTQQQPSNGNSTVTKDATYAIKQRSIKTVYNTTDKSLNAWGIESVNETGLLGFVDNPQGSRNASYGRPNMPVVLKENFSTYLDYSKESSGNAMNRRFNNAYYACMQRNRDENGDGKIQQNEIKWYLASSGQYVSLWLGKTALTPEASLFNIEEWLEDFKYWIPSKYHYTASDGENGKYVLWAEEGVTVGDDGSHVNGNVRNYRCVRDLNIQGQDDDRLNKISEQPELIYTASVINDGVKVDLSKLNEGSLKATPSVAELQNHDERDDVNKPYRSFVIAKEVSGSSDKWNNVANGSSSVCENKGERWRIPNQSELAFIYLIVHDGRYDSGVKGNFASHSVFARSEYSGIAQNGYIGKHAYVYNPEKNISLVEKNGANAQIRCVRDVQ